MNYSIILAVVGPWQFLIIFVPILIFIFGYSMGKKAGYIKRLKEEESKKDDLNH